MKPEDLQIAKDLKEQIARVVPLIDFRVFGSRARGDMSEYSDMDIFVEIPFVDKALKEKIFDISWEVGFGHFMVISVLIFSKEKFDKSLERDSPLLLNILREGIPI